MANSKPPNLRLTPGRIVVGIVIIVLLFWNQQSSEDRVEPTGDGTDLTTSNRTIDDNPTVLPNQTSQGTGSVANVDLLTEIQSNVFESPAGLIYRSGSADGHRLDHLMQHARDNPDKPVHGVFTGPRDEILALLDEVWKMSQERGPPKVNTKTERGRTVITADVGRKIGYVGGQSGKRNGYPACDKVRLVLEGQNVITAYPIK